MNGMPILRWSCTSTLCFVRSVAVLLAVELAYVPAPSSFLLPFFFIWLHTIPNYMIINYRHTLLMHIMLPILHLFHVFWVCHDNAEYIEINDSFGQNNEQRTHQVPARFYLDRQVDLPNLFKAQAIQCRHNLRPSPLRPTNIIQNIGHEMLT